MLRTNHLLPRISTAELPILALLIFLLSTLPTTILPGQDDCKNRAKPDAFASFFLPQSGGTHTLQVDVPAGKNWSVGNPSNIQWLKLNIDPRSAGKATIIVTAEPNTTSSCRLASLSISGVNPWYPLRIDIWQAGLPDSGVSVVQLKPAAPSATSAPPAPRAAVDKSQIPSTGKKPPVPVAGTSDTDTARQKATVAAEPPPPSSTAAVSPPTAAPVRSTATAGRLSDTVEKAAKSSSKALRSPVQNWQGRQLSLLPLPNSSLWIHTKLEGELYTARLSPDRLFRIRKPEAVRVLRVRDRDTSIEWEVKSERLGKGKVVFENAKQWPESVWPAMLSLLYSGDGIGEVPRFVGDPATRIVHFRGCNHIPESSGAAPAQFGTEADALAAGLKPCPLCFKRYPGLSGLAVERQLAAFTNREVLGIYGPPLMDIEAQKRVQEVGKDILGKWPMPLKGYSYRFVVLDSYELQAMASADGHIYITKPLLDVLDTDDELQAVLGHEIAHVEMRHAWRQFRSAQKAALWASIAAVVAAAATKSNDVAQAVVQMSTFVAALTLYGFQRGYEEESDSLVAAYFESQGNSNGKVALEQTFSKLMYGEQLLGIDPEKAGGLFATHPDLPDRIARAKKTESRVFQNATFEGLTNDGELVATLTFQIQRYYRGGEGADPRYELVALVDSTSELGEKDAIKDIQISTDSGKFKLDNKEDVEMEPGDTVGAVFVTDKRRGLVNKIVGVDLKLKNVANWQPARTSS